MPTLEDTHNFEKVGRNSLITPLVWWGGIELPSLHPVLALGKIIPHMGTGQKRE